MVVSGVWTDGLGAYPTEPPQHADAMYLPCISQWPPRHTDAMDAYPNCMRRPCMHPGGGCASQGANAPPRAASSGGTTRPRNAAATAASCCRASSWVSSWKPGRTHSSPMPLAVPATLGGAGDGAGVAPAGVGRGGLLSLVANTDVETSTNR